MYLTESKRPSEMIDVPKQVQYWLIGAQEDWSVARICLENGKARHALFFAHLTLEKVLKAHVCLSTQAVPPRIHNLRRLYDVSSLPQNKKFDSTLAEINQFNIEGRYPEIMPLEPDIEATGLLIQQVGKLYEWLIKQF